MVRLQNAHGRRGTLPATDATTEFTIAGFTGCPGRGRDPQTRPGQGPPQAGDGRW